MNGINIEDTNGNRIQIMLFCLLQGLTQEVLLRIVHERYKHGGGHYLGGGVATVEGVEVMYGGLGRGQRVGLEAEEVEVVAELVCRQQQHPCWVEGQGHHRRSLVAAEVGHHTTVAGAAAGQVQLTSFHTLVNTQKNS